MKFMATKYNIDRSTVYRIWSKEKNQKNQGLEINVRHKKDKCGRKPIIGDGELLRSVPLNERTTLRSFVATLDIAPSTVYRLLKKDILRAHTNSIKPKLIERYRRLRLQIILSEIIPRTINEPPRFNLLQNIVYIDEKWFFMSSVTHMF